MKRSRQGISFGDTLSRIRYKNLIYIALSCTIPFFRHVEFHFRDAYGKKPQKKISKMCFQFLRKMKLWR